MAKEEWNLFQNCIMPSLFDDDECYNDAGLSITSSNQNGEFKINAKFAKKYESYREKEEYQTLKDRFGEDDEDSSSSEEEVGPDAIDDSQFLKVMTALRQKDPSIYDKNVKYFDGEPPRNSENKKKRKANEESKPLLLDEYEREVLLREDGSDESNEESENETSKAKFNGESKNLLFYNDEQRALKEEITKAIQAESDSEDDSSSLLIKKPKPDPVDKSKGVFKHSNHVEKVKIFSDKEKDLLNFILDKSCDSENESDGSDNNQDENDDHDNDNRKVVDDEESFESDTEFVENQEQHEANYNFRFEVPGGTDIKSFPRNVSETLRQSEQASRSQKRREVKEKRDQFENRRKEDLKRLKQLKKKEILDKIEKIRESAGTKNVAVGEEDLESDFDPDKHDKLMAEAFNDEYYATNDKKKPQFSDMESDNYEEMSNTNGTSSKIESALKSAVEKPAFNPELETFEHYLEKNYSIDLDDVVEEVSQIGQNDPRPINAPEKPKFKFKYRETTSDTFGLTYEEILAAPDRELNNWVSLKKASQYRDNRDEAYDKRKFSKLANNKFKKAKIFSSLYKDPNEVPAATADEDFKNGMSLLLSDIKFAAEKQRRKKKMTREMKTTKIVKKMVKVKKKSPAISGVDLTDQRMKAFGIKNPDKFRHIQYHKSKAKKATENNKAQHSF